MRTDTLCLSTDLNQHLSISVLWSTHPFQAPSMCPSDTHPDTHFGSRPPFCTLTIEQAHCTKHHTLPTMPQQCRMGQLIISGDNFALLADPILDTPTPFSPCPFQLFPILHPKSNVNTKDWISMYFGFFHLISLNFLFEAVTVFQPY